MHGPQDRSRTNHILLATGLRSEAHVDDRRQLQLRCRREQRWGEVEVGDTWRPVQTRLVTGEDDGLRPLYAEVKKRLETPDDLFKLGWSQEKMVDSGLFMPRWRRGWRRLTTCSNSAGHRRRWWTPASSCRGEEEVGDAWRPVQTRLVTGEDAGLRPLHAEVKKRLETPDDLFKLGWSQEKMMDSGLFMPRWRRGWRRLTTSSNSAAHRRRWWTPASLCRGEEEVGDTWRPVQTRLVTGEDDGLRPLYAEVKKRLETPDDLFKLGWSQEKMVDSGLFMPRWRRGWRHLTTCSN